MPAEKTKTVLVVEDQSELREPIGIALFMEGYTVKSAPSRDAALEIVFAENPEVILLDWMMPGMSAAEFVSRVRAHDPGIRIVLMSGHPSALAEGARLGVNAVIPKPFDYQELTDALLD